jgi:hypothetical protein
MAKWDEIRERSGFTINDFEEMEASGANCLDVTFADTN